VLLILDGFGYSPNKQGNAIANAKMPIYNKLVTSYPFLLLNASGKHVGLLPNYIGNSEVGHVTLGAGRIIKSMLAQIHESINNKSFFSHKNLLNNLKKLKENNNTLHMMGLLSDGGVHSHIEHLYALLTLAKQMEIPQTFLHLFLDGRDVAQKSALKYLSKLETWCKENSYGKIATISGRFFAMDRDKNWDRTYKCYETLCASNKNSKYKQEWSKVIEKYYAQNIADEFIPPEIICSEGTIKDNDGIIFFNFRPDRARQLTEAFINPKCGCFKNNPCIVNSLLFFISPVCYKKKFLKCKNYYWLFEQPQIDNTLLDILEENKKSVFVIAETEKYAHVTYFFRGMVEKKGPNETYKLIPSLKVKNYINNPEMSAEKITRRLIISLSENPKDFYLVNYANLDMVGHSGDFTATVKACEIIDAQLDKLYNLIVKKLNGTIFIVGDHGNAEEKIDIVTGNKLTSHTKNPVPFIIINKKFLIKNKIKTLLLKDLNIYGLANVAPTILSYLNLQAPKEMLEPIDYFK
jgi:2,3-bisphosphoglycerate-independent phosphoglycerate mutase